MTPDEIEDRYHAAAVADDDEVGWDDPEEPNEDADDDDSDDEKEDSDDA